MGHISLRVTDKMERMTRKLASERNETYSKVLQDAIKSSRKAKGKIKEMVPGKLAVMNFHLMEGDEITINKMAKEFGSSRGEITRIILEWYLSRQKRSTKATGRATT